MMVNTDAQTHRPQRVEQSRARYPDEEGYVERDGVRIFYEVYGEGERTVLFLPTWSIIHSRHWKAQIPYFARHHRVLTFDGRGNGRSDRPRGADAYVARQAADHPDRVDAVAYIAPAVPLAPAHPERERYPFEERHGTDDGWAKFSRHYWLKDYPGFLEFFFGRMFTEPHSTKQIEDCVGWGLETEPETLIDVTRGLTPPENFRDS